MSHQSEIGRPAPGLIIAAANTGAGKTTVTLGLLRAMARRGLAVVPAKIGPDYIDPRFHEAACGEFCVNLDGWAMRPGLIAGLAGKASAQGDLVIAEGVMGLFDGGLEKGYLGHGSTADLAQFLGWPVVLVVDISGMGQSAAAIAHGFASYDPRVNIAGVILNKSAGERHEKIVRGAFGAIPVLGVLPRSENIKLPSRHLGLVQASERGNLDGLIDNAASLMAAHCDLDAIAGLAQGLRDDLPKTLKIAPPPGRHIAIANDEAFAFSYLHQLDGWREAGAEISFFSPLGDEAPDGAADAIYLPGGYPELHAARIAAAVNFSQGLRAAADRGTDIYGECGGYMVLGERLIDGDGKSHEMTGLLELETSFAMRKLHLGYRKICGDGVCYRAHEFHYATVLREQGEVLFQIEGGGKAGLKRGNVSGSFMHIIDVE